nr:SGNH/GDSL hydrolase family protein [Rhodopirellula sp. SM50]
MFRLQRDALQHQPDLLFVEFAVNDGGAAPERIHQSMEGIVRQTWASNPKTDICFVYTLTQAMLPDLQSGKMPRAASAMEDLADHYAIPSIHSLYRSDRTILAEVHGGRRCPTTPCLDRPPSRG